MKTSIVKLLYGLFFLLVLIPLPAQTAAPTPAPARIYLNPDSVAVDRNTQFKTIIYIDAYFRSLTACKLELSYNTSLMQLDKNALNGFDGVKEGNLPNAATTLTEQPGKLTINLTSTGAGGYRERLYTIYWRSLSAGTALLGLNITGIAFTSPLYSAGWSFSPSIGITVRNLLRGDINSDNKIDILDALMTARFSAGYSDRNFNITAADLDGDGNVGSIIDALIIARYYVGLIPDLPVQISKKIIAGTDVRDYVFFGNALAANKDGTAFITATEQNGIDTTHVGSPFIYKWNYLDWVETRLLINDTIPTLVATSSVDMADNGNLVIIGTNNGPGTGMFTGAAYVYRWNSSTWQQEKLIPNDITGYSDYGYAVAIAGDGMTAAVGGARMSTGGGVVYIFKYNGTAWVQSKIIPAGSFLNDGFGCSVALSTDGKILAVGAAGLSGETSVHTAYLYTYNGSIWQEQKIAGISVPYSQYPRYAEKIAMSDDGNVVVTGDQSNNSTATGGRVYVYRKQGTGWIETIITASDTAYGNTFGLDVDISGDGNTIVAGALLMYNTNSVGACYKYFWDGVAWKETKIVPSGVLPGDYLGNSVAVSGNGRRIFTGAICDPENFFQAGAVYVY